ncbi:MAG: AAA family ATPase [Thalassospira sp.]|uniref:AAA family ATPase n=1 Tax=Thalassospira sp. TaxID=1912094 RepID=UPI003A89E5B5
MTNITKLKLHNFKRFQEFEVDFDKTINLLIGDNESGKSSLLEAIDIVISGSVSKVQTIGLESLFNAKVIDEFLAGEKKYGDLPELYIELFLDEQNNPELNGRKHSLDPKDFDGLKLKCVPRDDLSEDILEILAQEQPSFPFEFYSINFNTFSGKSYTGYNKYIRHLLLDNTQINNEYATREYIKTVYHSTAEEKDVSKHQNEYRNHKSRFKDNVLNDVNAKIEGYEFGIRTGVKANLETDLTILEENIPLEKRGKGRQCFIKTEFALTRKQDKYPINTLLLEEPENHLSHTSMANLIGSILKSSDKQIFISTHSNMICSRLGLRQAIFLNSSSDSAVLLSALSSGTGKFFMKAPDNNVLELILSKKVLLVEGDAEFILMEQLYKKTSGEELYDSDVHVISVGGTSFKRYLELANLLNIKVAVVTDNDGDVDYCRKRYVDYENADAKVFFDQDPVRSTFEIAMYTDNKAICEELFAEGRIKISVQDYMLSNKADVAFELLDKKANEIVVPEYIREAIEWLRH